MHSVLANPRCLHWVSKYKCELAYKCEYKCEYNSELEYKCEQSKVGPGV